MTVPRVDPLDRSPRQPPPFAALVGVVAGPALFLTYYLMSVNLELSSGLQAAVAGLSIYVVAWSLTVYWIHRRHPAGRSWYPLLAAALPYGVLIWMAFDVLDHGDPAGVWASAAPTAVVLAGLAVVTIVPTARTPGEALGASEETSTPEDQTDSEEETPRERTTHLAVGVDTALWHGLAEALSPRHHDGLEQGGVALTTVVDGIQVIVGAVLPKQVMASSVRCEFSVLDVEHVRNVLDSLGPEIQKSIGMTWMHTHPRMGVFLSGTDVATSAQWRSLDPDFRPVVVDVTQPTLDTQIGVFDGEDRMLAPIGLVDKAVGRRVADRIVHAVLSHYTRLGLSRPLVLVGPAHSIRQEARRD